jgi:hypothetical protein
MQFDIGMLFVVIGFSTYSPNTKKIHGLSPRANFIDRATAAVGEVIANFC